VALPAAQSETALPPMNPEQKSVLGITSASHALIHVCELSVPPLLVLLQQEFSATDFELGQVVGLYGLLYGLGALPAGALVDRIGSKRLLVACLWGAACSLLGMASSPTLGWFAVCAAGMGLSLSVYHPAGTSLITHHLPEEARVFAIHGMAGSFGVAGASAVAGTLGALWGWRWALALVAIPALLLGGRVFALRSSPTAATHAHHGRIRWRRLALLLGAAAFMGMVYRGMTTFLPKLFAVNYGRDVSSGVALGGALTTGALLVGMAGMYTAGRLSDSGRHPAGVFFLGAVAQGPLLVAMAYCNGPLLVPLAMGVAFFHFWTQPVGNQLVAQLTPPHARGLGYGVYFFLAFGAGSTGASLSGWISDTFGLAYIFPVLAMLLVPSALGVLALRRAHSHD
jgi:MFS family permease